MKSLETKQDYHAAVVRLEQILAAAKPGTPEGDEYELLVATIEAWERRSTAFGRDSEQWNAFLSPPRPESEQSYEPMPPPNDLDVRRLSGPGVRIFFRIAQAWGLSAEEQCRLLGDIEVGTLDQWEAAQDATLTLEQLERISYIIGIYRSLHLLLPSSADGWVRRNNSNPLFQGEPSLRLMIQGGIPGLRKVRNYLAAQEGGWA